MSYDIAIIMVSYNKILEECLPSVKRAMDSSSLKTCFVLVDNGSTKFSAHDLVKTHIPEGIVVLRDKNYGMGNSCNRGVKEIDAEYYFFLNPDTKIVQEDTLVKLHRFLQEHPRAGIVAPRIHHPSGELQETCRRFPAWYMPITQRTGFAKTSFGRAYADEFLMRDVFPVRERRLIDWAQGSALFISSALFHELGGFDPQFWMYFEDVDLCRRAWEQHRPVYYYPEVIIQHAHGKASETFGHHVKSVFTNRALRGHIMSWIKYMRKWHPLFGRAVATRKI